MLVRKPTTSQRAKSTFTKVGIVVLTLLAVAFAFTQKHAAAAPSTASATQVIQSLILVGTSTIHTTPPGNGAVQQPDIAEDAFGNTPIKSAALAQGASSLAPVRRHKRSSKGLPGSASSRALATALLRVASSSKVRSVRV
jgi:hypothetical protein